MRARAFLGILSLGLAGGCALVFRFGDYTDASGGGGSGGSGGHPGSSSSATSASSSSGTGGAGNCKGDADCPAPANPCMRAACLGGVCGVEAVSNMTPSPSPIAGNCKRELCDGMGGIITAVDDTDLPNDGDPCTLDGCSGGLPTEMPAPINTPCGVGLHCDGSGQCSGCTKDAQCAPNQHCVGDVCLSNGAPNGSSCANNGDCASQFCAGNVCCATACPTSATCADNATAFSQSCAGGTCVQTTTPCAPFACSNGACLTTCAQDSQCADSYSCDGGSCCVSCSAWMTGAGSTTAVCGGSKAAFDDFQSCACTSCSAMCAGICEPNTGTPSGNCLGCMQSNCQMSYDACLNNL